MRATVRKWGNSASVRIPSSIMSAAKLRLDQAVDVREEDGRIVIEPVTGVLDLATLIDGISDDNRHDDIGFGPAVGKEAW